MKKNKIKKIQKYLFNKNYLILIGKVKNLAKFFQIIKN